MKKTSLLTPKTAKTKTKKKTDETFLEKDDLVKSILKDQKAEKITRISLRNKSPLADEMLIATGRSTRHLSGLADKIMEAFLRFYGTKPKREGDGTGWIVIDDAEVIVHLFTAEEREKYSLEELWKR